jgi:chaperone required for assembly of F1-ATPase
MNDPNWNESIRRAQVLMKTPEVKRFYETADVAEAEGGYAVRLDGRIARTPSKAKLIAPTRALAEAIAAEWAAQGEIIAPAGMPLTRLANTALDGVAKAMPETAKEIAGYAGTDLVCYRALEPEALVARQAAAFDPVLAFAEEAYGARFVLAGGIIPVKQPEDSLRAIRAAVEGYADPFALTALHGLTSLSGSVLIALMAARGAMSAQEAWRAAHVDEDYQNEFWGVDEEAAVRREARGRDFSAAAFAISALRG